MFFWHCACCSKTPAFFAPAFVTNQQFPKGQISFGLYGADCKLISALENPPSEWTFDQQTTTIVPGNVQIGNEFSITIGADAPIQGPFTVSYTAKANTVEDVVLGLKAAIDFQQSNGPGGPNTGPVISFVLNFSTAQTTSSALILVARYPNIRFNVTNPTATAPSTLTATTTYPLYQGFSQNPQPITLGIGTGPPTWNPISKHLMIYPFIFQIGPPPNYTWTLIRQMPVFLGSKWAGSEFQPYENLYNSVYSADQTIWSNTFAQSATGGVVSPWVVNYTEQGQTYQDFHSPSMMVTGGGGAGENFSPNGWGMFGTTYCLEVGIQSFNLGNPPDGQDIATFGLGEYVGLYAHTGIISNPRVGDMSVFGEMILQPSTYMQLVSLSGFPTWTFQTPNNLAALNCCDASGNTYLVMSPGANLTNVVVKLDHNGNTIWTVPLPLIPADKTGASQYFANGMTWNNGKLYLQSIVSANQQGANGIPLFGRFALKDSDGSLVKSDFDTLPANYFVSGNFPLQPWLGRPATYFAQ